MKQDTHPDYHFIEVVLPNGSRFKTRSTYGKEGAVLQLLVLPRCSKKSKGFLKYKSLNLPRSSTS